MARSVPIAHYGESQRDEDRYTAMTLTYADLPNKRVTADNGIDYAYVRAQYRWCFSSTLAGISTVGIQR